MSKASLLDLSKCMCVDKQFCLILCASEAHDCSSHFFCFMCLCRFTFRDRVNQSVTRYLVKEVNGLNLSFDAADIRGGLCSSSKL